MTDKGGVGGGGVFIHRGDKNSLQCRRIKRELTNITSIDWGESRKFDCGGGRGGGGLAGGEKNTKWVKSPQFLFIRFFFF